MFIQNAPRHTKQATSQEISIYLCVCPSVRLSVSLSQVKWNTWKTICLRLQAFLPALQFGGTFSSRVTEANRQHIFRIFFVLAVNAFRLGFQLQSCITLSISMWRTDARRHCSRIQGCCFCLIWTTSEYFKWNLLTVLHLVSVLRSTLSVSRGVFDFRT